MAAVVAIGLVSDARSNTVSRVIGNRSGCNTAWPRTHSKSRTSSSRGMRAMMTAPGISAFSIDLSTAFSTRPSFRLIRLCFMFFLFGFVFD